MTRIPPDEQLLADGLWYLENMARTHECIAAVLARYRALEAENARLARYRALEAENARLNEACDRIARAGMHESDERG